MQWLGVTCFVSVTFPIFISLVGQFYLFWDYIWQSDPTTVTYDFIIVGGGTAGCVLANRLSEISHLQIALVEAGSDSSILSDVPATVAELQNTVFDWQYRTVPQKRACQGLTDKISPWPRGKLLGGSSQLNYMLYFRGNRLDYDNWNSKEWTYDKLLPYFRKLENFRPKKGFNEKYRGRNGPMSVEMNPWAPLLDEFLAAGKELGYDVLEDYNGEKQTGFAAIQKNLKFGRRCGTYQCYLSPVRSRSNLHVIKNALVEKILIDSEKRAYGIQMKRFGRRFELKASKEVISSAGAIGSPQLLHLSGIGPRTHLSELSVSPVIADLPVGENLQDHLTIYFGPFLVNSSRVSLQPARDVGLSDVHEFAANGTGLLTTAVGMEGVAFFQSQLSESSKEKSGWPDIQMFLMGLGINDEFIHVSRKKMGINENILTNYLGPYMNRDAIGFLVILSRPKSRGYLRSRSGIDPMIYPEIDPNYLEHADDQKVLVEGLRVALKVAGTAPFQAVDTKLSPTPLPGCEKYFKGSENVDDEYLRCYVQSLSFTLFHPVGTCSIGKVVDDHLKVLGVKNLRVVDASVMPSIPNANTHVPVVVIAERAADVIKSQWDLKPEPATQSQAKEEL